MLFRYYFCVYLLVIGYCDDRIVIDTSDGPVKGIKGIFQDTGDILYEFRGIPYAKPPVGQLRFKDPLPLQKWTDTLDTTSFGNACPQMIPEFIPELKRPATSEDCLYLNIYAPKVEGKSDLLSVMVWIHGGGYEIGFGHEDDLSRMAIEGNVIMVSMNYRLGIFGFFALDHPAAWGNYGLKDQRMALQWVHNNIKYFGGNPNSVTIFGESAGGNSVSLHSLIPSNEGLFQRVIAQSGVHSKMIMRDIPSVRAFATALMYKLNCVEDDFSEFKLVDCFRNKSVEELLEHSQFDSSVSTEVSFKSHNYPVIDRGFIDQDPIIALQDKTSKVSTFFNSLDLMAGATSNEGSVLYIFAYAFPGLQKHYNFNVTEGIPHEFVCDALLKPHVTNFMNNKAKIKKKLCDFYHVDGPLAEQSIKSTHAMADLMLSYPLWKMLSYHMEGDGKTYQYVFSKTSPEPFVGPPPEWFEGCGHRDELIFLFKKDTTSFTNEEKEISTKMIQYWTSFAKTGIPNGGEESVTWATYNTTDKIYLDFDNPITLKHSWRTDAVEFWSDMYKLVDEPETFEHDEL